MGIYTTKINQIEEEGIAMSTRDASKMHPSSLVDEIMVASVWCGPFRTLKRGLILHNEHEWRNAIKESFPIYLVDIAIVAMEVGIYSEVINERRFDPSLNMFLTVEGRLGHDKFPFLICKYDDGRVIRILESDAINLIKTER